MLRTTFPPERRTKRGLAGLGPEYLLGNDGAGPTADEPDRQQRGLRDAPGISRGGRLVRRIDDEGQDTRPDVDASHPAGHAPEKGCAEVDDEERRDGEVGGRAPLGRAAAAPGGGRACAAIRFNRLGAFPPVRVHFDFKGQRLANVRPSAASSAITRPGSAKAYCAGANETPCLPWFSASFWSSHSKPGFPMRGVYFDREYRPYDRMAMCAALSRVR